MKFKTLLSASLLASLLAAPPSSLHAEELLTPAEMLKRLQEEKKENNEASEEEGEEAANAWPSELPTDLPLYPGIKHEPVKLVEGYYRFNIEAPTSDRAAIIETFRKEAEKKGWSAKADQKESENTHSFHFKKGDGNLIVKVTNDGVETKTVYFEFMTDEFIEKTQKRKAQ